MTERVYNFSPGPAVLPLPVLEQVQREMLALPGVGSSILEISHRSKPFLAILEEAEANLRRLLGIGDDYKVLFLQGGSRLQFSMIPMNLLRDSGRAAEYVVTGSWGEKAAQEAAYEGEARVTWSGKATNYDRLPAWAEVPRDPAAAYVHITSNETIQGVQFADDPDAGGVPLVCDASSDFLHRPVDISRYGIYYACAQKNAGPAGVTIVVIRNDLVDRAPKSVPGMLNYAAYANENSMQNTPNTFGIYVFMLITRWLEKEIGGLAKMLEINRAKAKLVYDAVDESGGFYRGHAQRDCRSLMNVTFRLPDDEMQKRFLAEAGERKLCELKGHRSVGGIRASIYNAMPIDGARRLAEFMRDFCASANCDGPALASSQGGRKGFPLN
jgi:phosphoserine aminotransferase